MLNRKGMGFVTLMVMLAVFALLLRFAIESIIKINITQNESQAHATLKLISAALDNYAREHLGAFPQNLSVLTANNPAYLDKDYISQSPLKGYEYSCPRIEASGYSCQATPVRCKFTGKMIYTVSTGGLIIFEDCSKKE